MRFLRVHIRRFGPLTDVHTGEAPLPGLTVVLGPNEAGKSSFFMALRALLYGIYPTRPDLNPYAPWDGAEIDLEAEVEGGDGRGATVHRRLLSSPWGRLRENGGEELDLRNETLPWASHVPREIYEEIFSITLPELVRLQEGRGWEEVRDRLLAGMGTGDLAAPRKVAESMEGDAQRLWRPDRRGRPRHQEVEETLAALSDRLARARERDALLRRHHRRLGAVEEELVRRRDELTGLRATLERIRVLIPLRTRLRRMEERRLRSGDPQLLEGIPGDPPERLLALRDAVDQAEEALDAGRDRLGAAKAGIPEEDPVDRRLLSRRDRAWALTLEAEVVRDWQGRRASAAARLEAVEEEVGRVGEELFGTPDEPVPARAVLHLSTSELADRIRDREEGERRRAEAEERLLAARARPLPPEAPSRPSGSVMGLAAAGLLLLLTGALLLLGPWDGGWAPGLVALLAGAVVAGQAWVARTAWARDRDRIRGERQDREEELHALESREAELAEGVREVEAGMQSLMAELPLRAERRERPREGLVHELVRLQDLFRRRESARAELRELDRGLNETGERLARLLREVEGLELPADPVRALPLLAERLDEADGRARARQDARKEVDRAQEDLRRLEEELGHRQRELAAFQERLHRIQPEVAPEEAAREAASRLGALRDARRLQEELEEEAGSLEDLRRRIASLEAELAEGGQEGAPLEPEVVRIGLEEAAEELRRGLEELREEAGDLRAELRTLSEEETVDVVEAALAELREERATLRRERDRLWVLARAVRVAERRYREAHQPDLTRRASRYLEHFTGGRYTRLLLGDDGDPDTLLLQAPHLPGSRPVMEPLSTGTREQVFLALRLAVVDQMDREGARLPLALDETLVNWDADRRQRGLDLLKEVARERQVLLFTCHPGLAREAAERGARLVELPGPA